MGMRWSNAYNICKKDIKKSCILKHFNECTEWWVYKTRTSSRFVDVEGKKIDTGKSYLACIIVCELGGDGKRQENEAYIAIDGVKFTNDDKGNDLDEYLSKSGRK